ncbi:ATP-dependent DNA helicase RecG, partial [Yoonia sp.]|nr:ATP-dependent DNA helicase RecG [Yoonia sp.]
MSGRPEVLFPLFAGLTKLDGIGPKSAQSLEQVGVLKPRDILMTLPVSGVDRSRRDSVKDVIAPAIATVEVLIGEHHPPRTRGRPYRVFVEDAQTSFQLVFFHARGD